MNDYRFAYKNENILIVGEVINGRLIKYFDLTNNLEGNIYRARVLSYINSMDSYILDIGEFKNAILKKNQVVSNIKNGDDVIVEVINVPDSDKLIEVTEKITLSDGYIVLAPYISKGSKNFNYDFDFPFILRTKAKDFKSEIVLKRYNTLLEEYKNILKEKNYLPTPKLLKEGKFLNNYISEYSGEFIGNFSYQGISLQKDFNPDYVYEISVDKSKINSNKIEVNNSNIIIESLEALTVIDVNAGSNSNELYKEEMSLTVNLSVIEEIAIQISLRQIKKMVLIDFIRVNNKNKNQIIEMLKLHFEKYKIQYKIFGFTRMGLLELVVYWFDKKIY